MSPILHFNFVSKLYGGSISDKEIVNASGFLGKLQPGDAVMADRGFNIQDFLALDNAKLMYLPEDQLLQDELQLQGFILSG